MRKMKKKRVLKLLGRMADAVDKMPDEVRIERLFVADDGKGLSLERGIEAAAVTFGKAVKIREWSNGWKIREFHIGDMTVTQIERMEQI